MRHAVRRLTATACCVAVVILASAVTVDAAPSRAAPDPAVLDRVLADAWAATGLPGMAAAVTHGPDVVHLAGFGTDGRGGPVTPGTRFRIASLSKSFTATAVLQLAAAHRIDLDAPVRRYLPGFATGDPGASTRISVRHLLNQTSGIADTGFPAITADDQDLEQRVTSLRTARPESEPGTEFHYSDLNYQVLARVVEVVAGEPWAQYLSRQVFAPLGMTRTFATATASEAGPQAPDLADGHVLVFDGPVARAELDGTVAGSTGVVSTAEDMARWLVAQSTAGGGLLPPEGLALLQSPPPGVAGGYGMGWQVVTREEGPRRIEHTGVLSTFSAVQVLLPESGYAFALLFNGNSALADTAGVTSALATLLSGNGEAGTPRSTALVSAVLGGACVLVLGARTWAFVRLGRWRRRRAGRPWWAIVPGIAWLVLPAVLLAGLVPLVSATTGRVFTFWQLSLAMPDVVVLLGVAALTGVALAVARVAVLVADRRSGARTTR
ncbi:serine hydrolase domain-containing protein [Actinomycetospora chibensis]|uniref:Serine hydrolase domain-containing protein n=1 Tax=Actinomycetospora chibensis TaxID=663606 RepID=A0ABV9RC99_9PSEU|nr:serine hydrolase domain-containing protein [Actinomycetospora chibensis]MDD7927172.1 serine hydrolase [Actinomycetospora chibensis]